jgi:4-aminobutyrate aminotransferase
MTKEEILLAQSEHLFPCVFHYYQQPLVISHARNQYVWDLDGKQYLDFFGGIVTVSVGHCNEDVNRKVHKQMDRLQHVSTVFVNVPQVELAKKLAQITPGGKLTKSFFTSSGTEANEIVALRYAYHGRSSLAMGLTAQSNWRLGPVTQAGIVHAVNAYCYRCPYGLSYPSCEVRCAQDVEQVIRTTTSGRIAGFIAEPIQGVAGFVTPPKEYFPIVAETVKKHGGVFISDEVQTGWGRTGGKWFGIEQWGVQPDIITSAKGLANGAPIGLTIARPEIADSVRGASISTFGGNPIATTAAKAVIDFIEDHKLSINAAEVGAYFRDKLLELQAKHPIIGDVRGMGLLQAIELVEDPVSKTPAVAETLAVMEAARENGILLGKGGLHGNILRFSPPLNISKSDVDEFARLLDASLVKASALAAV